MVSENTSAGAIGTIIYRSARPVSRTRIRGVEDPCLTIRPVAQYALRGDRTLVLCVAGTRLSIGPSTRRVAGG